MTKTVALLPELVERVAKAIRDKWWELADSDGYVLNRDTLIVAEAAIEATQTDQQLREEVERLRRVLEHTADGLSFDIDRMDAKGMGTLNIKDMQSIARDAAAAAIARMGV